MALNAPRCLRSKRCKSRTNRKSPDVSHGVVRSAQLTVSATRWRPCGRVAALEHRGHHRLDRIDGSTDSNCSNLTQFQCALNGVQVLLQEINPCPSGASSCTEATANVKISLFTFPKCADSGKRSTAVVNGNRCGFDQGRDRLRWHSSYWTNYAAQPIAAPYTCLYLGRLLPVYSCRYRSVNFRTLDLRCWPDLSESIRKWWVPRLPRGMLLTRSLRS